MTIAYHADDSELVDLFAEYMFYADTSRSAGKVSWDDIGAANSESYFREAKELLAEIRRRYGMITVLPE